MPDSDGYETDIDGYHLDRQADWPVRPETSSAGDEPAWPEDVHPELIEIVDAERASRGETWRIDCIRRWRYFDDLVDPTYADKLLAQHLFLEGILDTERWPPRREPPQPRLPQARLPSTSAGAVDSRAVDSRTFQVNVRLREWDYVRLAEVANRYGIAATTLARLFVARGVEAAMDR